MSMMSMEHKQDPHTRLLQPQLRRQPACFLPMLVSALSKHQAGCRTQASLLLHQAVGRNQLQKIRLQEVSSVGTSTCSSSWRRHFKLKTQHTKLVLKVCLPTGLRLQQAAEQLLPSSGSDSEPEDAADQAQSPAVPGTAKASHSPIQTDSDSEESVHRKHKRQQKHSKHKKHRC